jgi:diguanylate cyclase (GGDEF)-like protein
MDAAHSGRLPAVISPFGPFDTLVRPVHELTVSGRSPEALAAADRLEHGLRALGDLRSIGFLLQCRMYALVTLGRQEEALAAGEELLRLHRAARSRPGEAKALADVAEVLIKLGRTDDGLYSLARALELLELVPASHPRYGSVVSSVGETARAAELYELADDAARIFVAHYPAGSDDRAAGLIQHAELLLEWGLRLDHLGEATDAAIRYERARQILEDWVDADDAPGAGGDAPRAQALLALALAKTAALPRARRLAAALVGPARARGQFHEARLAHLAYGATLRATGEFAAARREFRAAAELASPAWQGSQHLIFEFELALLAIAECPDTAGRELLAALRGQARRLWALRSERLSTMRQNRRRVELEAERARAQEAASRDALTGLGNRRGFDQQLAAIDRQAEAPAPQRPAPMVLLLIDVDRFKDINDGYSHGVGDRVLREVADVLRGVCRQGDVAVRFGGDEFAAFLRTDLGTAARIAERFRRAVLGHGWDALAPGLRVTLSVGAAQLDDAMTGRQLFDAADRQLYAAKRAGRNRVATD